MAMDPDFGSWYPSCVVKLTIRYDESMQVADTGEHDATTARGQAAQTQEGRITGNEQPADGAQPAGATSPKHRPRRGITEHTTSIGPVTGQPLDVAQQNAALSELDEYQAPPGSEFTTPGASPVDPRGGARSDVAPSSETVPVTFGTDGFTVIANRVPKKGSFTLAHPRSAATFSITFDYTEFPVDPRIIRAVGVEVHLGAVSAEDYARGMAGEKDTDGRPLSILKTTSGLIDPWSGRPATNDATLLFHAIADTWDVDHSDGGSYITIEGRDIRSLFIDAKAPLEKIAKIDLRKPINEVVEDIIRTMGVEHDLRMNIMIDAAEWPEKRIPSPGDVDGLTRVRLGSSGQNTSQTPQTGTKTSYWDLITNYCTLVGGIPQFQGSSLWIRPARRVFDVLNKTLATPFRGGAARRVGTEQLRARRLVYGRDIKRLRFQRKFQGTVVPTIQTISYDDRASGAQRLIFGQWPPATSEQAKAKAEGELLRIPMHGIRSVKQLNEIAHDIYEEIGRGEVGGTADTQNLASYGGDNSDPDMLRLRPMEPVEFVIDKRTLNTLAPVVSELTDQERRSFSEEVDVLHRRLGDRALARVLTAMARGTIRELIAFYQVIGIQYEWGGGLKMAIQFQNYIVPRHKADRTAVDPPDIRRTRIDVAGAQRKAIAGIRGLTAVALTALAAARSAQIGEGLANGGGDFYGDGEGSQATAPDPGQTLGRRYRRLEDTNE